ncbi:MAG: hypothetical protein AAF629_10845 [Chloroflexota bacterium]
MTQEIKQSSSTVLPSFGKLFGNALRSTATRMDLPLLLALPLILFPIMEYLGEIYFEGGEAFATVQGPLSMLAMLGFIVMLICNRYIVSQSPLREVSLSEAFSWLRKGGLGFLWVFALSTLSLLGGLTLLIIPGLLVYALLYLASFVYIREDIRGTQALAKSYDLVKGNYWGIFVRRLTLIVATVLLFCLPSAIVLLFLGDPVTPTTVSNALVAGFDSALLELITEIITMLGLTSMITVSLFFALNIYESLSKVATNSNLDAATSAKFGFPKYWFRVLPIIGVVSLVVIVLFLNIN